MAKHPVPKKKQSKQRSSRRYSTFQTLTRRKLQNSTHLSTCSKCGAAIRMHHLCKECGFYNGKDLMGKTQKKEEKVTKIKAS